MKKEKKKIRAIIYARLSGAEVTAIKKMGEFVRDSYLENSIKIAEQEKICKDYCAKNNISVLSIYHDKKISDIDSKLKGLCDMMSYCKKHKGKIDAVIVTSRDRISPSKKSYIEYMHSLSDEGVKIMSVNGGNSDEDRFNEGQLLPFN